jgi:RNA polymerase sigma-70 factor (ECF subfamily)
MLRLPDRKREAEPDRNRAQFEQLAEEHSPRLFGAALRMARHREEAEDLLQDSLVQAYRSWATFTPGTNFRAWVLRIMTNRYIMAYRRRQRVAFTSLAEFADRLSAPVIASEAGEPLRALLAGALDAEISAALAELSEPVRLTVLLVDVEELGYEEAAAALAVPVGTVRSRLSRGRQLLRSRLAEWARDRRLV